MENLLTVHGKMRGEFDKVTCWKVGENINFWKSSASSIVVPSRTTANAIEKYLTNALNFLCALRVALKKYIKLHFVWYGHWGRPALFDTGTRPQDVTHFFVWSHICHNGNSKGAGDRSCLIGPLLIWASSKLLLLHCTAMLRRKSQHRLQWRMKREEALYDQPVVFASESNTKVSPVCLYCATQPLRESRMIKLRER